MPAPHSSWAEVYDLVYERSFGEFYRELTAATLEVVCRCAQPPARIVDFGAGTGRLAIPLAEMGFEVTAVEPCREMLDQLKAKQGGAGLNRVCSTMGGFPADRDGEFDLALCVFTVLLYLLDEEALKKSLEAAWRVLKAGGLMLIDIPTRELFQGYSRSDELMSRSVTIDSEGGGLFSYHEEVELRGPDGEAVSYEDRFQIRYWPPARVTGVLREVGFVVEKDLSREFCGAGAQYYLLRKAQPEG